MAKGGRPKQITKMNGRAVTKMIDKAIPMAASALIEALDAYKMEAVINGRDENGKVTYKYVKVPDWYSRISAAKALLNKRIPDVEKVQHTGENDGPIKVILKGDDANL